MIRALTLLAATGLVLAACTPGSTGTGTTTATATATAATTAVRTPGITVTNAIVGVTQSTRAAGVFFTIDNVGLADRLVSASSPAAQTVEIHTHIHGADGTTSMQRLPAGQLIPADASVEFVPGGLHIMLIGLTGPITEGQRVPLALQFERAGQVQIEAIGAVPQRPVAAQKHTPH